LWNDREFVITEVQRDRDWWATYFPMMKAWYEKWQTHKAAGISFTVKKRTKQPPTRQDMLNVYACNPYPFQPAQWTKDRVLKASGAADEFTEAPSWEIVMRAAVQEAIDAAANPLPEDQYPFLSSTSVL
jgi:methionine aminopeptidase